MKRSLIYNLFALVLLAGIPVHAATVFNPEELGEGVTLFRPVSASPQRTNSLVVEQERGLLVVEAQPSPAAARELLKAIASFSDKPIRFLVLSHPHAEAVGGVSAFPESVLIIASGGYKLAMQNLEHDFGAEMRVRASDPAAWKQPPTRSTDIIVATTLLIDDPQTPVLVKNIGRTHSPGGLQVELRESDILYMGATHFLDRNPYAKDGNFGNWLGMLNAVSRTPFAQLIPLHGEVTDIMVLRRNRDAFAWLRGQLGLGFIEGMQAEDIPQWMMKRPELDTYFDTTASPSFLETVIEQALKELVAQRAKRGR
jgi:glyoxylase-like metal-dependent hydrolase (beta-lactamase superfamily II)